MLQSLESLLLEVTSENQPARNQDQTASVIQNISNEKVKIYNRLKAELFNIKQEDHTRVMVQKYYNALILLINQTYNAVHQQKDLDMSSREILEYLFICLEEIQQFIEVSYPQFLSPEERVPIPELMAIKTEMEEQFLLLPNALKAGNNSDKIIGIVMDALRQFVNRIDQQDMITVKETQYHKEMIRNFLNPKEPRVLPDCPTLHELLFYWNFNTSESIAYFTSGLEALFENEESQEAKLEFLHFQFKRLLHLPVKPKTIYDKRYPSMKSYFTGWITNEIGYLEKKKEGFSPLIESSFKLKEKVIPFKVLVALSADQIGLILRAAKELKLFVSKSIEAIFKAIIPYISTNHKEELSWKSMLGKVYAGEERDKRIAIEALQQLIKKIENY
ncbi:hypothetical protein PV783_24910 [Chitinophaga sp. CC14]|uniref:hypothetical protein n=1 Tax=Chitinophaga sp. CC14 TaxID=3029199 RepID=UPI003B7FF247